MTVRATPSLLILLVVIGLAGFAAAARVHAQDTNVQIESLSIDGNTLTITGKNFGSGTPAVQVGTSTAAVSTSSDTEIVAQTVALTAGTHIVTVVRDANEGGTARSTLRIQ